MFIPEKHHQVWGDQLKAGLAKRDPARKRLDISAGGMLAIGEDLVGEAQKKILDFARPNMALYVGGMGARGKNFYNDICRDYGYEQEAVDIQDLYLEGKKDEAAARVPGEWLELSNLVGPKSYIKERIGAYKEAGVTVLSVNPVGPDAGEGDRDAARDRRRRVSGERDVHRRHGRRRLGGRAGGLRRRTSASGEEVGAGVSVYHRGEKVVDLWGGSFDADGAQPYDDQALQLVFSTTKGITAIAVGDLRPARAARLRQAGRVVLAGVRRPRQGGRDGRAAAQPPLRAVQRRRATSTLEEALDWDTITARLADTAPEWPIGTAHGYHALTYGWLAGELVRRVDPQHRSLGTFVRTRSSEPLGVELWIGLPEAHHARVSPIIGGLVDQVGRPGGAGDARPVLRSRTATRAGAHAQRRVRRRGHVQPRRGALGRDPGGERRDERPLAGADLRRDVRAGRRRAAARRRRPRRGAHERDAGRRARRVPDDADHVRHGVHGPRHVHAVRRTRLVRAPRRRRLRRVRPARARARLRLRDEPDGDEPRRRPPRRSASSTRPPRSSTRCKSCDWALGAHRAVLRATTRWSLATSRGARRAWRARSTR